MLDRRPQLGSQTGQTAAEAMGVLLLVSLIIAALVISGVGQTITDRTAELICKIAGSSREQPERTVDGEPPPYMLRDRLLSARARRRGEDHDQRQRRGGPGVRRPGAEVDAGGADAEMPGEEISVSAGGE